MIEIRAGQQEEQRLIGNNNVVVDEVCLNDWGFYEGEHRATGLLMEDQKEAAVWIRTSLSLPSLSMPALSFVS